MKVRVKNPIWGVPITFLNKYNPTQFEIIALGNSRENFTPNKDYIKPIKVLKDGKKVNGNAINCVLAIESKTKPINMIYYTSENVPYLIAPYARILIKKKDDLTPTPTQFEIIGLMSGAKDSSLINGNDGRAKFYINGKGVYARILIRKIRK